MIAYHLLCYLVGEILFHLYVFLPVYTLLQTYWMFVFTKPYCLHDLPYNKNGKLQRQLQCTIRNKLLPSTLHLPSLPLRINASCHMLGLHIIFFVEITMISQLFGQDYCQIVIYGESNNWWKQYLKRLTVSQSQFAYASFGYDT